MALAADAEEYWPPKGIQRMETELAGLPVLWAEPDDPVVVWGWSRALRNRLRRMGVSELYLPSDEKLAMLRAFSSREFCVDYSSGFYAHPQLKMVKPWLVENRMFFCHAIDELERAGVRYPYIVKSAWSSSGKGNVIVRDEEDAGKRHDRIRSIIGLNGASVDVFYNKVLDFAMEFRVMADRVEYLGLSVFEAAADGKYGCNYVASQDKLARMIAETGVLDGVLDCVRAVHAELLADCLRGKYEGVVGVDMMVVRETDCEGVRVHPCVELNLRMNMGVVALKVYEKFGDRYPRITLDVLKEILKELQ